MQNNNTEPRDYKIEMKASESASKAKIGGTLADRIDALFKTAEESAYEAAPVDHTHKVTTDIRGENNMYRITVSVSSDGVKVAMYMHLNGNVQVQLTETTLLRPDGETSPEELAELHLILAKRLIPSIVGALIARDIYMPAIPTGYDIYFRATERPDGLIDDAIDSIVILRGNNSITFSPKKEEKND